MAVKHITVGPGTFTVGAESDLTNLSSQATAVKLVPSVDVDDPIRVLSGETIQGDRSETWTIEGTLLQDLGATESTTEYLFNNAGEEKPFSFTPANAAGKSITGTLVVEAIEMGGDVGTKATSDFEFAIVGRPVIGSLTD